MLSIESIGGNEDGARLVRKACRRLKVQRFVPVSPGRIYMAEVLLCDGTAPVREAIPERCSDWEGREFACDLASRNVAVLVDHVGDLEEEEVVEVERCAGVAR